MAYNKFKIEHLKTKLNLTVVSEYWLETTLEGFPKDAILDSLLLFRTNIFNFLYSFLFVEERVTYKGQKHPSCPSAMRTKSLPKFFI